MIDKNAVMTRQRAAQDPLLPIEVIVRLALSLLCGLTIFSASLAVFVGGVSFGAWGSSHPCVEAPQLGLEIMDATSHPAIRNLRPGVVTGYPASFELCDPQLSGLDRTLGSAPLLLDLLWSVGFLWLTLRLIGTARRGGLFTHEVARGPTRLGWYILGGTVLVNVVGAVLTTMAISHLVIGDYPMVAATLANLHLSWAVVIAGCGVVSVGRVLQQTVPMREEIDATV